MNNIDRIIKECINKLVTEAKMDFDFLYFLKDGDDITKYVNDYLNYSIYGEKDPSFSILACKLHDALMYSIGLYHDEENDRRAFSKILNYCKYINRTVGIKNIKYDSGCWVLTTNVDDSFNDADTKYIDPWDFKEGFEPRVLGMAIAYQTFEGVKTLSTDYRPGSDNGSSGDYTTSAVMNEEMKQKIYSMHLVPALLVEGSYHENFVYSVGILPQYVSEIKNDEYYKDVIYFDCKF